MSEHDERVEALATVLAHHHIEIEHRAYPTFACAFEDWDGAEGDNGGDRDGIHDTRYGHGLHLARVLLDSPVMRDLLAAERAKALREAADDVSLALANEVGGHTSTYSVRNWLRERADEEADRIHPADPEETR